MLNKVRNGNKNINLVSVEVTPSTPCARKCHKIAGDFMQIHVFIFNYLTATVGRDANSVCWTIRIIRESFGKWVNE